MKQLKFLIFITSIFAISNLPFEKLPSSKLEPGRANGEERLSDKDFAKSKSNFGKTHFILGYDDYDQELQDDHEVTRADDANEVGQAASVICADKDGKMCSALFAPDHNLRAALRHLIQNEQEKISIAIYAFTDAHVAKDLIKAHERGVKIEVVTDPSCLRSPHHKIDELRGVGIPVYVYKSQTKGSSGIMHNKFALFEKSVSNKKILWTGSFNFTKSGSDTNQENVLLLDDPKIIGAYADQFEKLKERTEKTRASTKTTMIKKSSITTIPS